MHTKVGVRGICWWLLAVVFVWATADARQVEIGPELERLAGEYRFEVTGSDVLEDAIGRAEEVALPRRLRVLLERFDHIIVHNETGGVARVIIIGRTNSAPPPKLQLAPPDQALSQPIELETIRQGSQHSVRVTLEGVGGRRVDRAMLIDTGADTVVLPASMITPLGLNPAALSQREVQTANGRVQARIGTLDGLWLDGVRLASIEVAFLESDKLGTGGLLGMSVLGRYQMTIDDEKNRLTLTPAGAARDREAAAESAPATPAETSSEPVTQ